MFFSRCFAIGTFVTEFAELCRARIIHETFTLTADMAVLFSGLWALPSGLCETYGLETEPEAALCHQYNMPSLLRSPCISKCKSYPPQ